MPHSFSMQFEGRFSAFMGLVLLVILGVASPVRSHAQEGQNRILSISVDKEGVQPAVHLFTENPVGYRYTVYDSFDPVRVVLDFPGMDVSALEPTIQIDAFPLQEIRVSSFELTSGKLGRVELLLRSAANYDVGLSGNDFHVSFTKASTSSPPPSDIVSELSVDKAPVAPSQETPVAQEQDRESATNMSAEAISSEAGSVKEDETIPARQIRAVEFDEGRALLKADGQIDKFQYFSLGAPSRLVVDVYGVQPEFKERAFPTSLGFSRVRIGTYKDKTRFVFDAEGVALPKYSVDREGNAVLVTWGADATDVTEHSPTPAGVPVSVDAVDFQVKDGKSVLAIELSRAGEIIVPEADGDIIRFGLRNANISRALRRTIDASVFPSAVRLVTPYTVLAGDIQDVRFAVELKGPVPYELHQEGKTLLFTVDNGPFAEVALSSVEKVNVPVPVSSHPEKQTPAAVVPVPPLAQPAVKREAIVPEPVVLAVEESKGAVYTGEKINLVFDDADIRRIFQLIGEVSDLNVLVGDEVKGTITLRLIDVPWDQALDLILDTKNLGMLKDGNVVRILPKDKIRAMRQAELTAVKEERALEPLVTEVISVSYTDLGNISGPAAELLTDRGKITPDNRNKQLIVTDIPATIEEVKKLVAILDTPEKQVMIEARIVEANTNVIRDLGVSWNFQFTGDGVDDVSNLSSAGVSGGGSFVLNPAVGTSGLGSSFTFGQLGITSSVLDLRLSAAETAGNSKVISKPRVSTLNGETAVISQGTQIPYQSVSDEGTKTEFVDATLELNVTPIINPDDSIILEIKASNNTPTTVSGASAPGIDKKEATTKVLVKNGETTVIGGIFTESESDSEDGIPLLRKIPILGYLFKSTNKSNIRSELLIFITPRILD